MLLPRPRSARRNFPTATMLRFDRRTHRLRSLRRLRAGRVLDGGGCGRLVHSVHLVRSERVRPHSLGAARDPGEAGDLDEAHVPGGAIRCAVRLRYARTALSSQDGARRLRCDCRADCRRVGARRGADRVVHHAARRGYGRGLPDLYLPDRDFDHGRRRCGSGHGECRGARGDRGAVAQAQRRPWRRRGPPDPRIANAKISPVRQPAQSGAAPSPRPAPAWVRWARSRPAKCSARAEHRRAAFCPVRRCSNRLPPADPPIGS